MGPLPTPRPKMELLNRVTGGGLAVSYTFTRTISVMSSRFVCIELSFTNFGDQPVKSVHIGNKVRLMSYVSVFLHLLPPVLARQVM